MSDVETTLTEDKRDLEDYEYDFRPDPVPFQRQIEPKLKIFRSASIHCLQVVEKVETRKLHSFLPAASAERVLVVSPKSLLLCDMSGPVKRLIKMGDISELVTQKMSYKAQKDILHLLIKVPTHQDLLLALVDHPFNKHDFNKDGMIVEIIQRVWACERYDSTKEPLRLPVRNLDEDPGKDDEKGGKKKQKIVDFLANLHEEDLASSQKCKSCQEKDKNIRYLKEMMQRAHTNSEMWKLKASKVDVTKETAETFRVKCIQANKGRDMYKAKCKELMKCVEILQQELDDWKDFSETLVKQIQILNVPTEIPNLCNPRRVATLEKRLDEALRDLAHKATEHDISAPTTPTPEASLSSSNFNSHASLQNLTRLQVKSDSQDKEQSSSSLMMQPR
eukprot:TRINITY_DN6474_c2_g1_i1.p1 TRINITY_DN6474_c2_g1~~TRINITY_DN6474_c2_g1_i1.p1  ORF type:complete len:391 (+),score=79.82 TRINITY_DN6474_c2_g1_i1:94-1266(+)